MNSADSIAPAATIQIQNRCTFFETVFHPKIQIPRKVDSKKKAASPSIASGPPNTLPTNREEGDQEGETDGDRNEEEVVDARTGELPAGKFEAHGVSLPSVRTAESPSEKGDRGSTGDRACISSSRHRAASSRDIRLRTV